MAARKLSMRLMPVIPRVNSDLRQKHGFPEGFFYINEAGELYCTVAEPTKYRTQKGEPKGGKAFNIHVLRLERGKFKPAYRGVLRINPENRAELTFYNMKSWNASKAIKPGIEETGRQAFRIAIESALRQKPERLEINPANKELEGYYRKKFNFRPVRKKFLRLKFSPKA